jgi:hypothetical protein
MTLPCGASAGRPSLGGNFVIRVRAEFVAAGYAIAYLEDPRDLRPAVERMRRVARPVFVVSTSNGTIVAARNAAALGADGPDGLVLTSTVTRSSFQTPRSVGDLNLRGLRIPVLFVHNANDGCSVSPPAGIAGVIRALGPTADVTRIDDASTELRGSPCEPFSPHGYLGIEDQVVAKIVAWMRAHAAPGP